jgi:hypothetical protein
MATETDCVPVGGSTVAEEIDVVCEKVHSAQMDQAMTRDILLGAKSG